MKSEEARAALASARAKIDEAQKAGDEAAELRAIRDEELAVANLREAETNRRLVLGKRLERAARTEAAGRYQVGAYDFGTGLLELDPARIPCDGVAVWRSAAPDVRDRYQASAKDNGTIPDEATITYICECLVGPKLEGPEALRFRAFWENDGRGLINLVALHLAKLGGVFVADFQRTQR